MTYLRITKSEPPIRVIVGVHFYRWVHSPYIRKSCLYLDHIGASTFAVNEQYLKY